MKELIELSSEGSLKKLQISALGQTQESHLREK
jgi:hypothetical protein